MQPKITAIISAAGSGTRMGYDTNKLLIDLKGKTILARTLEQIARIDVISGVVLVIRPEDEQVIRTEILPRVNMGTRPLIITYGGATREDSTWQGILAAPEDTDIVLTHDGARPFVTDAIINRCIKELLNRNADGVICTVPVKDTIKVINKHGYVETTPKRSTLFAVQTPQVFYRDKLKAAYVNARSEGIFTTDDAQIVEVFGGRIFTVEGSYENIKVTTRDDLLTGQLIIEKREEADE